MKRLAFLSCLAFAACGGSSPPPDEAYDFAGQDGALQPKADLGRSDMAKSDMASPDMAIGDAAVEAASAPVVTVVSPASGSSVTGNSLALKVHVTSPVGNVIAGVAASLDSTTTSMLSVIGTTGDWSGTVDVSTAPSAAHTILVTATDAAGLSGNLSLTYTVDHGPNIVFLAPTAATAKGSVAVRVTVNDPLHGNTNLIVTASVRNTPVTLTMVTGTTPPEYDGTITFNQYTPPLNGAQLITVTAMNGAVVTMKQQPFTVDEQGPSITIVYPVMNALASGVITVQAIVTDDLSGVDDGNVFVVFGGDATKFKVQLKADPDATTHLYTGTFDIGNLGTLTYVTPSVAVTALDKISNSSTVSEQIIIDNVPPTLSLDPPKVRIVKTDATYGTNCTSLFDPLGDEALNDATFNPSRAQLLNVRAQIEDRGNTATGQTVVHVSGIDPSTVTLYAISAAAGGTPILAVDSDSDGFCDSINPNLTAVAAGTQASLTQFFSLPMVPLTSVGTPNYGPVDTNTAPAACGHIGGESPPDALCPGPGTSLTYTLQYLSTPTPAIWSLPLVDNGPDQCVGAQLDTLSALPEGSACLVVAAKDFAGNRSISAPLRTCIRRTPMSNHPCDTYTPPDCTGTYDHVAGTVSATACTPINDFVSGAVRTQ